MLRLFAWLTALLLIASVLALAALAPRQAVLGSYSTSLDGRAAGQRDNAERAAHAINGVAIAPGATFSFNHTVGPWTADRGYVKAPVSYSGELRPAWGGGVCQTSTTLYNAALLAGLDIVERHRHMWAPHYVPPGRDAAVAQYDIDLRLRNPYPWPVTIETAAGSDRLGVAIRGREQGPMAKVEVAGRGILPPSEALRLDPGLPTGERHILNRGKPGCRVMVTREFLKGPSPGRHELVSEDRYPAMNRIVRAGA